MVNDVCVQEIVALWRYAHTHTKRRGITVSISKNIKRIPTRFLRLVPHERVSHPIAVILEINCESIQGGELMCRVLRHWHHPDLRPPITPHVLL